MKGDQKEINDVEMKKIYIRIVILICAYKSKN